jgi:hypothetical protein
MPDFELSLPADLEPVYTNRLLIQHTDTEFLVDAFVVTPGQRKGRVRVRLVMGAETAKGLAVALSNNVSAYEENHGAITLPGELAQALFSQGGGNSEDE